MCLVYDPALRSTLKRPCVTLVWLNQVIACSLICQLDMLNPTVFTILEGVTSTSVFFLCNAYMSLFCRSFHLFSVSILVLYRAIGLMSRVFVNDPGDLGLIPGQAIPKTQKMALNAALLSTQHYKVQIKGKVEQSRERNNALPYTSV